MSESDIDDMLLELAGEGQSERKRKRRSPSGGNGGNAGNAGSSSTKRRRAEWVLLSLSPVFCPRFAASIHHAPHKALWNLTPPFKTADDAEVWFLGLLAFSLLLIFFDEETNADCPHSFVAGHRKTRTMTPIAAMLTLSP